MERSVAMESDDCCDCDIVVRWTFGNYKVDRENFLKSSPHTSESMKTRSDICMEKVHHFLNCQKCLSSFLYSLSFSRIWSRYFVFTDSDVWGEAIQKFFHNDQHSYETAEFSVIGALKFTRIWSWTFQELKHTIRSNIVWRSISKTFAATQIHSWLHNRKNTDTSRKITQTVYQLAWGLSVFLQITANSEYTLYWQ